MIRSVHAKINRIFHRSHMPYGAILMFHRIDTPDANGIWYNEHLKIAPSVIEEMSIYARDKGCEFVPLEEIARKRHLWEHPRRLIAITLDDGYRDNYTNGGSLFRRLNMPYCIYVCTEMVEGKMLYWWEILEWLVIREERITINHPDGTEQTFDCSTSSNKEQAFLDIRDVILHLPQDRLSEQIKVLFSRYDIDYNLGNDTLGLTWDQVRELAKDPLCTIGNHTYSHLAFSGCSDQDIEDDIHRAETEMKAHTGYEMCHFAFPFGEAAAVSQHDIDLVKRLGYKTSATTKDGFVCYGTDKLELPRIFVTERNWKDVIDRIANNC